jgi:hypothetical protein
MRVSRGKFSGSDLDERLDYFAVWNAQVVLLQICALDARRLRYRKTADDEQRS